MTAKSESTKKPTGFAGLGLADELLAAVTALGYEEPTPVQREAIPLLIEGRDLLGMAATGTGKTAAFALPMIQRIAQDAQARLCISGLVLVPTRELAMQVAEAIHKYAKGFGIHVVPVYGGAPMHIQIRALERGASIVVATPGRALDHIRRKTLRLEGLKVLVLDEADEMLDMGFAEDIDAILTSTPATRQTALFSATMPPRILSITKRHLKNPIRVAITTEKTAAGASPRVRQVVYSVTRATKPAVLGRVLDIENPTSAIVFCRTRLEVESLVETLTAYGHRAQALHGGMEQRQRDRVMSLFRAGSADLLIATDVAARGLDIERLSHVVNYDVPAAAESYVHRIGRTGRAGRAGTAITLAEPREHRLLRSIENLTKQKMEIATVPTVADVRARRLDVTRASLRELLLAGKLDDVRVVVESLAQEFDIVDVAAAAVKMAHEALEGTGDDKEIATPAAPSFSGGHSDRPPRGDKGERGPRREAFGGLGRPSGGGGGGRGDVTRLFIGAGRQAGIRPGDLVGAITGEAGIDSRDLGAIEITDRFSLIEVPEGAADEIVAALRATTIRGKRVQVRRDREGGER
ncbi:MAG: DEAD/DEAH box helicase [Planctomycetes bacterium]|nr:DEAD/DEAH box helicase [Planctomycetota bacterium]